MYNNWKAQASGCSTSWICMMRERKREDILNPVISGTQALPHLLLRPLSQEEQSTSRKQIKIIWNQESCKVTLVKPKNKNTELEACSISKSAPSHVKIHQFLKEFDTWRCSHLCCFPPPCLSSPSSHPPCRKKGVSLEKRQPENIQIIDEKKKVNK